MWSMIKGILEKWRIRKRARAAASLEALKIHYHTFRIVLADNERALDLLNALEQRFKGPNAVWAELTEAMEELLDLTYEMVDGINRLTHNRHAALYGQHQELTRAIRQVLAGVTVNPPSESTCLFLEEIRSDLAEYVGGKAASLALLKQSGLPVPDGFVVTSRAAERFFMDEGLGPVLRRRLTRIESIEAEATDAIEQTAREIHGKIMAAPLPRTLLEELSEAYELLTSRTGGAAVSMRSSARVEDGLDHSFAGQFKSVLNVRSFDRLQEAYKEVLASNFNARSMVYRLNAGLPLTDMNMAVLCQRMVPARTAGVLFTLDPTLPESGRMLISAVLGLGITAVGGDAPADVYRPPRENETARPEPMEAWTTFASKPFRMVPSPEGGLHREDVPPAERERPVLSPEEIRTLVHTGHIIESLQGHPQDIEWAFGPNGNLHVLQSRPVKLPAQSKRVRETLRGEVLLKGGVCASPGRRVGRVKVVHSPRDLEEWAETFPRLPSILVLHQSLVDVARWLPEIEGAVVDLGNPADHLSCVAREYNRPMLTGTVKATRTLQDGQWIILDADRALILRAPHEAWTALAATVSTAPPGGGHGKPASPVPKTALPPELSRLHDLTVPLHLTDAYGPTFSILECRSLHDIIRYVHEKAVLAMFDTGDEVLENTESLVHRLEGDVPFHFLIIDLGGGIAPDRDRFRIRLEDLTSTPLLALREGIVTPGLRWNLPPPIPAVSGLMSRSILDSAGARPVGNLSYALITRDYLNLNARVDYHFAMIDTVCGPVPRENYIRFRFKGGGTNPVQRTRRARLIAEILDANDFMVDQQEDLVTSSLAETLQEEIQQKLVMLGRLLGFTRLMDAAMIDDAMPGKMAAAFLSGDYRLESLKEELALQA